NLGLCSLQILPRTGETLHPSTLHSTDEYASSRAFRASEKLSGSPALSSVDDAFTFARWARVSACREFNLIALPPFPVGEDLECLVSERHPLLAAATVWMGRK